MKFRVAVIITSLSLSVSLEYITPFFLSQAVILRANKTEHPMVTVFAIDMYGSAVSRN